MSERCDFHSQRITQSLLSISLNQETSGRSGRRIRLAQEREGGSEGEKGRVASLILMGFSEVFPSLSRNMWWDR